MEDDDGRRRRLSRRRLSSCSHGNVGTRPIRRSYGLLDNNFFALAAANGWLPPNDLPTRIPILSHPAHRDARACTGAGAHDPDADPAAADVIVAARSSMFFSPTTRRSPPSPLLLPSATATSSPSPATSPAPEPQLSPRTPARRASPLPVPAELRAQAVECRTTLAAQLAAKVDAGRLTGADLFFLAFKASRY